MEEGGECFSLSSTSVCNHTHAPHSNSPKLTLLTYFLMHIFHFVYTEYRAFLLFDDKHDNVIGGGGRTQQSCKPVHMRMRMPAHTPKHTDMKLYAQEGGKKTI
ncbi:hypothetical protein POVWA2_005240 [Plasmodium ovale wallikeri]|uniref:Uncharacterized protein n=1 Tax=Plasmodium ovale wallikeri TaxID=864142 RepID=A0A1A8YJD3_PLAOA|nr:hypothetical protein POVWA1_005160 [Plasmodium ovale wallikeri]SBT31648.1 hypothetical protein POVWA2_005240 [Plasmodium ovale wallikeri]